MGIVSITVRKGDFGDTIASGSFSHDVSDEEVAAIASVAIEAVAKGLILAAADKRRNERRTRGDAAIHAIFEDIRQSIATEFGPTTEPTAELDSRDPRYVPSDDEIVKEHDPGPEVDDQGGASEFPRFTEELDRNPDGTPV